MPGASWFGQHRIAADLPHDQIGRLIEHVGVEARDHLRGFLAANALVENRDRQARKACLQFSFETRRIGHRGRRRAGAECRRRTDRDDLQRQAFRDPLAEVNRRALETSRLERRGAPARPALSRVARSGISLRQAPAHGRHCPVTQPLFSLARLRLVLRLIPCRRDPL